MTREVRRMLAAAATFLLVALVLFCLGNTLLFPIFATMSGLACVLALGAYDHHADKQRRDRRRKNGRT